MTAEEIGALATKAVLESRKRSRSPYVYERLDQITEWIAMLVTMAQRPGVGSTSQIMAVTTQPSTGPTNDIAFVAQPVVTLTPAVGSITVTAILISGDGTQSGGPQPGIGILGGTVTAVTNGSGVATFTNLKITGTVGDYTLVFTAVAAGYTATTGVPQRVVAGAATKSAIITAPAGASTGELFVTQPVIGLQDVSGNFTGTGTTGVVAAKASGTGTLSGTTTVACVDGVATFTDLVLTGSGDHTLSFTPTSLTAVTSGTIALGTASATALAIGTQPSGAAAGVAFTVQPTVQLTIAATPYTNVGSSTENPVSDSGKLSTITGLGDIKTDGTFQCANPAVTSGFFVNSTGLASVGSDQRAKVTWEGGTNGVLGVVVREQGDGAHIQWYGATDGTASAFRRAASSAGGGLTWFGQVNHTFVPGDTIEAIPTGDTVQFLINDVEQFTRQAALSGGRPGLIQFGDTEGSNFEGGSLSTAFAQASVTITAAKQTGTGTLSGTTTANTDANGLATFTNLALSAAGDFTLRFSSGALTTIDSATIVVSAGAATQLGMVVQPSGATDNVNFTTQPQVRLLDSTGNPVLTSGVAVTEAKQSGSGTLSGTMGNTNASGISTGSANKIVGTGSHVIRFSSSGLTSVDSASFTVQAAAPPPDPGGLYPNKPSGAGWADLNTFDFSQNVPAPDPRGAGYGASIIGSGGWGIPFSAVGNFLKQSDGTAISSPSSVWQLKMAAGTYGSPTSGTGFGDLGINIGTNFGFKTEFYVQITAKRDSNYEWHPNNEKWWELDSSGLQMINVAWWGGSYWGLDVNNVNLTPQLTVYNLGSPGPQGAYQKWEWHFKYGAAGTAFMHIWRNGTLLLSNTTTFVLALNPGWQEMYVRNFRGGGGETKTRDSYVWYDHIHIAGKA